MDFGYALNALREGQKVSRSGWNGKGMYIFLNPAHQEIRGGPPAAGVDPGEVPNEHRNQTLNILSYIMMKTVQGDFIPWLASQADLLGEDWGITIEG